MPHTEWSPHKFVTIGENISAGVGQFSLNIDYQQWSFPAQLARQMGIDFIQPLIEQPGIGSLAGIKSNPIIVPDLHQTSVRTKFPPENNLSNLSIPGFTLLDALNFRPKEPLVNRKDSKQTLANFILGFPGLTQKGSILPTQIEYANQQQPDLLLIALGFQEALAKTLGLAHSAVTIDDFCKQFNTLFNALKTTDAEILLATIPNPLDTSYFSSLEASAAILRTTPDFIKQNFEIADTDLISLPLLYELGYQFIARKFTPDTLEGLLLSQERAAEVTDWITQANQFIAKLAKEKAATLIDLNKTFNEVNRHGFTVGDKQVTSEYLGGFYLLNGLYPSRTGHAYLANRIIEILNQELNLSIPSIDLQSVANNDPDMMSELAPGPVYTDEFTVPRSILDIPTPPEIDIDALDKYEIQTIYPDSVFDILGNKSGLDPHKGIPAGGLSDPRLTKPIQLPPGCEQTLRVVEEHSYFGDAIRITDYPDEEPFLKGFPTFGANANLLFGGYAMTGSHLRGQIHIKFSEPDENNHCTFEIRHPGGLVGRRSSLASPQLYKLPLQLVMAQPVPNLVSTGVLDLNTGIVTDFHYNLMLFNTALMMILNANPNMTPTPIMFPGPPNGGSTWARFEQRQDGKLDISISAHAFLPLGKEFDGEPVRLPLPFGTPDLKCATIMARGMSLHPHIFISTKDATIESENSTKQDFPENKIVEFTNFVRRTAFGDEFNLNIPEFGGSATGRSQLIGRLKVQFGPRFGDSILVAINQLPPGGLLSDIPKPYHFYPPGSTRGWIGFDEKLQFPKIIYEQFGVANIEDPNNISIGAVNLRTGEVRGELLKRSFVLQKMIFGFIEHEPGTPTDSFLYQGPACFEFDADQQLTFNFNGEVYLPYPTGYKFPSPDNLTAYIAGEGSRLDPFLHFRGIADVNNLPQEFKSTQRLISSIEYDFEYRLEIATEKNNTEVQFEYTNHTKGGSFVLTGLSWLSMSSTSREQNVSSFDTVTLGGFGTWSLDPENGIHQVSAHICTAPNNAYVGILIDGGLTSNANTKLQKLRDSIPEIFE